MKSFSRFNDDVSLLINVFGSILDKAREDQMLADNIGLLANLFYCRIVDTFLVFLSDFLTQLFRVKPEMLRSNEKVDLAFILEHQTMDTLLGSLIERKVTTMAFEGMRTVSRYFDQRLNLPLFSTEEELETAILAVEIRNLFTHNRGIVNRLFRERVPRFKCEIDDTINIVTKGLYGSHASLFMKTAAELSTKASEKFGSTAFL